MLRRENRKSISGAYFKLNTPYKTQEPADTEFEILNISRGGLRFSTNQSFIVDDRINITVYLENKQIHTANGRICYSQRGKITDNNHYYGLSFLDNFIDMSFCT